jgi:hypothetical protein
VTFCCVATTFAIGGCGKGDRVRGVTIRGQVLQNGQPIPFLPSEEITVGFSSEAPPDQAAFGTSASVKSKDGTFTMSGPSGAGIPPGTYRVSLSSQIYGGSDGNRFEAVFEERRPPLMAEVGSEKGQTFVIDVGKWTVTKQ